MHAELSDYILYSRGLQVVKVGGHSRASQLSPLHQGYQGYQGRASDRLGSLLACASSCCSYSIIAIAALTTVVTPSSFMMGLLQVLDVPSALVDEIRSSGLPSATLPSDHLCLVAGFRVCRSTAPAARIRSCGLALSLSRVRDVYAIAVMLVYGCSWMMAACTAAARPSRCPWLLTPCCTESACPPR